MWIAVRGDLLGVMGPGKAVVQAGRAFGNGMVAAMASHPELMAAYLATATPKISVVVRNEAALLRVRDEAEAAGIFHHLVLDAGRTVFVEPTRTVCGFGPALRDDPPAYLRRLRMLTDGGDA